jgi:hypothetical protein
MTRKYCTYCGEKLKERCNCEFYRATAIAEELENYDNSLEIQAGWSQQDLIDSYRMER